MSTRPVSSLAQVNAGWLSEALRGAGALQSGCVAALSVEASESNWSRMVWIRAYYSADARGELPAQLALKICADSREAFGPSEVFYYTRDYRGQPRIPLLRCYHAAYQEQPRAYHLLLADVRATHSDGFRRQVTRELALATADALARLHAPYWGAQRLATLGCTPAIEAELDAYFAHIGPGLEPLLDAVGSTLSERHRGVVRTILGEHPRLLRQRIRDADGFTLVHGDLNPGNVLWPREGTSPVYLIDRQPFDWSLQCWLGASDLARAMILPWLPELRRPWQLDVLRQYQSSLQREGIELSWPALLYDYRLAALESVEIAVEWCSSPETLESRRELWQWQLERSLQAVDELAALELLAPGVTRPS
ncbi:MAG: hypothetical protein RL033_7198 [Pseudomonadota bacterium]|jgi:hypothetical protein